MHFYVSFSFLKVSRLGLDLKRMAMDDIDESPRWREWELWRALGG